MDWYLPGTKAGGPVRSVYSLVALLKNYFDLYIITTNTDLGSAVPYKNISPDVLFVKDNVNYYYFSNDNLSSEKACKIINEINPALVYLNSFWSYNFSIAIVRTKAAKKFNAPILLAPRGMLSAGALGLKSLKKNLFLTVSKLFGWYNGISFHATNEAEKKAVIRQFKAANVFIASNINAGSVYKLEKPKEVNHIKLFYLSRISKVKNLHFALEALRDIPAHIKVDYDIYGNIEDKTYWNLCEHIIKGLPENIKVVYRHELQFNEVQPIIVSYHALFLPTLNENYGHSIVESLLCGCPVIISDQTPWNELEENNAGYCLNLGNKQAFVKAIIKLATLNKEHYSASSQSAINYISARLNINQNVEQYKRIFDESIKNGSF